jgi:ferredoxin, 2Fe-2S
MAKITYIEFNGDERVLDLEPGTSVMQGAVGNGVRGIIGDCGGACSCATCHVYVDPAWLNRVGEKSAAEAALLEEVCDGRPNSRLSCQIKVTAELDGLVVRLPARQV